MDYQSFQPNPPTPQMSQQMSSVQKTFTPKFIGVVVGLLVLGGVVSAGLWFWNDKNKEAVAPTFTPKVIGETAGWQTYRNEEYGFEFRYPASFKDNTFSEIDYMFTVGSLLKVQFVDFDSSPNNDSERVFALNQTKSELLLEKEEIQVSGTTLTHGMKALIKNQTGDGLFMAATIFTPTNDRIWFVMQLDLPEDVFRDFINKNIPIPESMFISPENQRRIKTFNQILSTFKFTTPVDTSNWKTYTNTKYGFEFKYPAAIVLSDGTVTKKNEIGEALEFGSPNETSSYIFAGKCVSECWGDSFEVFQTNLSIKDWFKGDGSKYYPDRLEVESTQDIILQGYPATQFKGINQGGLASFYEILAIKRNNFIYWIRASIDDKILSTFKFIP